MSKNRTKSVTTFQKPKTKIRDATLKDVKVIGECLKSDTIKFFGNQDLELEFRNSNYSLVIERESGQLSAYANIGSSPNLSALPKGNWLDWIHFHFGLKQATYGNTLFLTFLFIDDPYNTSLTYDIFEEIFLREPKIKLICTVAPPIYSVYKEVLALHSEQRFPIDTSINGLSQSIFICEKYKVLPKMRFRRALSEDNDDLVEIIDRTFKSIRKELGQYYIAEQVMRNDPGETIVVAERQKAWSQEARCLLRRYGRKPFKQFYSRSVIQRPDEFFDKAEHDGRRSMTQSMLSVERPMSMNNLLIDSSSNESDSASDQPEDKYPKSIFKKWKQISENFKFRQNLTQEVENGIQTPKTSGINNAFAIQLFGLSDTVDQRRIYEMVACSFSSYPDKEYCMVSLPSTEASSKTTNGSLLRYFSRVTPRIGCKVSVCLYVAHRNSILSEIELSHLTNEDIVDVETILSRSQMNNVADILRSIDEYLTNQWSTYDILSIRSQDCLIGFVVSRQNCTMNELKKNYVLDNDEDLEPPWTSATLEYFHLHPAFISEWAHVTREFFRLTGYSSMFYKLKREFNQANPNSIILKMFPILPRKELYEPLVDPYALYYLNSKMCHMERAQIENRIVIVGFNETCMGFLKTLLFSPNSKEIQYLNLTVLVESNDLVQVEAEYDTKSFKDQKSLFFQANSQFSADFLRKLEFRTWVNFVAGNLKEIKGDDKKVVLQNGTVSTLQYDRLLLCSSSSYNSPKTLEMEPPTNYLEINSQFDKIIFYHKIQLLKMNSIDLPLLIYGSGAITHSCISILIDMGIKPTQIYLLVPKNNKINFPETFDDEYVTNWLLAKENELGVRIFQNLNFVDWNLHPSRDAIEIVSFESDSDITSLRCLAFLNFRSRDLSDSMKQTCLNSQVEILNDRVIIDEYSRTNVPFVYACGTATQYHDDLLAGECQQKYFNQIEVGNHLARSFIKESLTGLEGSMIKANFVKPIFRQYQLLGGYIYAGLREPGRYFSRQIRNNVHSLGQDLITCSESGGEYCRLHIDQNGFVSEITCVTRKYKNLEILYRIYGLHETCFNNLRAKCEGREIGSLLDYFHQSRFSAILHDQFKLFRRTIRTKSLDCLKECVGDIGKINKAETLKFLQNKKMDETIQNDLIAFIQKQVESLHQFYALPNDFLI